MMRSHWIEGMGKTDKIARDQLGPLMDQLVEGMLTIGTGLTPDNRTSLIIDNVPIKIYMLAIALHIKLLQIGTEAIKILIIWENCHRLRTKKIVIPDTNQGQ